MQGTALGWNAGFGNLGVGVMQAVVPLTIYGGALAFMGGSPQTYTDGAIVTKVWMQNAAFIWIPFILIATFAAAWGQNNIRGAQASLREQVGIFQRKHAWILAWLYTGTFGSFIGFAAAFPQLLSTYFPTSEAKHWAFVGPLLGALVRPLGGWLSDRLGGAKVTFWNFAVMLLAAVALLVFLPSARGPQRAAVVLRELRLAVHHHRHRQRFGVPRRPQGLPASCTRARPGKTRRRRSAPIAEGEIEVVGRARLHRRHRGARAVLHPGADRHLHQFDRDGRDRAHRVRRVLCDVPVGDLVVVLAQGRRSAMRLNGQRAPRQRLGNRAAGNSQGDYQMPAIKTWNVDDKKFWESTGKRIANRNLWISIPALLLAFAVWMVWSVVVAKLPAVGFKFTTDQLFWLAAMPGLSGADAAHFLFVHAADLRRPAVDGAVDRVAADPGDRHRIRRAESRHALPVLPGAGAAVRLRRRQLRVLDGQYQLLLPARRKKGNALALNAGLGNLGVSVVQFVIPLVITAGVFGWLGGDPQSATVGGKATSFGCRTPASSGCRSSPSPPWRPGSG